MASHERDESEPEGPAENMRPLWEWPISLDVATRRYSGRLFFGPPDAPEYVDGAIYRRAYEGPIIRYPAAD